jgi:hypothetical protein
MGCTGKESFKMEIAIGIIGILMISFGIWGIVCWDDFTKLSSNIKEIVERIQL